MSTAPAAMDNDDEIKQFKRQCIEYLDKVLERIRNLPKDVYVVDDEYLATLNVRRAEPLDIEEKSIDFGPRFFSPRFSLEEAQQKTVAYLTNHRGDAGCYSTWPGRCRRGSFVMWIDEPADAHDPEEFHPLCTPQTDAEFRLRWFKAAMGVGSCLPEGSRDLGVWEGSDWYFLEYVLQQVRRFATVLT